MAGADMQSHPNVPQPHPLKFRTILQASGGPKAAINDVIDDCEELEEYAESCVQQDDREVILAAKPKFEREKVIGVALGERPTAGFEVEIVCATQITGGFVGLQTVISYVVRSPGSGAAQVITHPHHVVRVKNAAGVIVFRRVPDATTMAIGEEGPPQPPQPTTLALGEEDPYTTMALGEEGPPQQQPQPQPTTLAIGEEQPQPTTLALGEEQGGGNGGGGNGPFGAY